MRLRITMAATMLAAMLGGQGCFTGYLYLDSASFREDCRTGDTCKKAMAIEATATAVTAFAIAGGALIAKAVADDDSEGLPPEEGEVIPPPPEPKEDPRKQEEYPGWP
jgi:hypothetical protein